MDFDRIRLHRALADQIAARFSRQACDRAVSQYFGAVIHAGQAVAVVGACAAGYIRTLIETRYGDAVSSKEVAVAATPIDRRMAHRADFQEKAIVLRIDATGFYSNARALFTQTAYAPAGPYRVKFRTDTN